MKPKNLQKKALGQHWLRDAAVLQSIVDFSGIQPGDLVLEIGPGLGTLTEKLVNSAEKVVAVEYDHELAQKLRDRVKGGSEQKLEVIEGDILKFDFGRLPADYKVVANIPYYLTSKLIRTLTGSTKPPAVVALLVQKEVAERICAKPGGMNLLAVSAQLFYDCELGIVVPAELFDPPPKVDSRLVLLKRRQTQLFDQLDQKKYFRVVRAGFSERRKKLRSSIAGGLGISRQEADSLIKSAGIDPSLRAQELSLEQWYDLYKELATFN